MSYRQFVDIVEDLRQRMAQLRQEGCLSPAAADLLSQTIEQFACCAEQLGRADAERLSLRSQMEHVAAGDARQLLEQREQRLRSLFTYNLDAIFALDPQGRFTAVNPAGEALSGYPADELLRMNFAQLLAPESFMVALGEFAQALAGTPRIVEVTFVRKDGQRRDAYVTGGPVVIDGQSVGVFGIARDITEQNRLKQQLEQRVAERTASLEAANLQLQAEIAERRRAEEQLRVRGNFQRLIAELSANFIRLKTEQIDEGINQALERIGRFAGVDRSCICQYSDDRMSLTCTHEWCAPGIDPSIQDVQADPTACNPWITPLLLAGQIVHVPRVADLPAQAAAEKRAFTRWGTQSFVMVPLVLAGQVVGVVGFDSVREEKTWPDDIIDLLRIVGEMLVNTLQRRRTEQALRQSEARYRALIEQIPAIVYTAPLDGSAQARFISPQIETVLGFSIEEWLGTPGIFRRQLHPEDRDRVLAAVTRGEPYSLQYRLVAADGHVVWMHDQGFIIRDSTNRPLCTQGVAMDVTGRVLAEQALRASEQRYRTIVENTHDVIVMTDGTGRISYISPSSERVLGYAPEELIGQRPAWIIHPDDVPEITRAYAESMTDGHAESREYRIFTKNGQRKWISHSWTVIPGDPEHAMVSVVHDITERKAAQAQIEQHQEQLRALASELVLAEERERRRLAGDLHDDVGQLLTLAQIRLGVLDRSTGGTLLAEPVAQLRRLIEQTLETTRSLTFQLCPPTLYDLGLVAAAEWLVEDMQQRYGLRVDLIEDGADKPLDERLRVVLFRSLREILINVAKHAETRCATVEIRREGAAIRIRVGDEGAGFDPSALSAADRHGFGLFSIQERLSYLGGSVTIRSAPGQGTTVTLEAPLKVEPAGGREEHR